MATEPAKAAYKKRLHGGEVAFAHIKQAMGLLLTGQQITASQAYQMGLVNEVVAGEECLSAASRWAHRAQRRLLGPVSVAGRAVLSGRSFDGPRSARPELSI